MPLRASTLGIPAKTLVREVQGDNAKDVDDLRCCGAAARRRGEGPWRSKLFRCGKTDRPGAETVLYFYSKLNNG